MPKSRRYRWNIKRIIILSGASLGTGTGIWIIVREVTYNTVGDLLSTLFLDTLDTIITHIKRLPTVKAIIVIPLLAIILGILATKILARFLSISDNAMRKPLIAIIISITTACFIVLLALAWRGDPVPTPIPIAATLLPTLHPTPSSLIRCFYEPDEWPCWDVVRDTRPRDTLHAVVRRNYKLEGDIDPLYVRAVCDANWEFLSMQFLNNIPPYEREIWGNDPCNYLIPGNILIIPIPPLKPSGKDDE